MVNRGLLPEGQNYIMNSPIPKNSLQKKSCSSQILLFFGHFRLKRNNKQHKELKHIS